MKYFVAIFLVLLPLSLSAQVSDRDADGLSNELELVYGSDPDVADSDGDGYQDGLEVASGYSPTNVDKQKMRRLDSDADGLNDAWEIIIGTDLTKADSDDDGIKDGAEVFGSSDPLSTKTEPPDKKIKIDLQQQRLTYYFNDQALDSFLISSGVKGLSTPVGEFKIFRKLEKHTYGGTGKNYYYPNTKWNLQFLSHPLGGYYIHGAYWHNQFGRPMSHGCVNVAYSDMADLYRWSAIGTPVIIK